MTNSNLEWQKCERRCADLHARVAELEAALFSGLCSAHQTPRVDCRVCNRVTYLTERVKTLTKDLERYKHHDEILQAELDSDRQRIQSLTDERDALVEAATELQRQARANTSAHMKLAEIRTEGRDAARAEAAQLAKELAAEAALATALEVARSREACAHLTPRRGADRLREALEGIADEFERTVKHHLDNDGKGMQAPFHGDFAAAKQIPSLASRIRWWAKHLRAALAAASEENPRVCSMCLGSPPLGGRCAACGVAGASRKPDWKEKPK